MYGTIFNLNVKVGLKKELIKHMKSNSDTPDGMVAWFLMSPDDLSDTRLSTNNFVPP